MRYTLTTSGTDTHLHLDGRVVAVFPGDRHHDGRADAEAVIKAALTLSEVIKALTPTQRKALVAKGVL